jgi:hypothetical protein
LSSGSGPHRHREDPVEDIHVIQDVILVISNGRVGLKRLPFGRK